MELNRGAAIVTGAGGGIGSAIARRLASDGMDLVLADRDEDRLVAVAESLPQSTTVATMAGDVADPSHHEDLVNVAEELGGLRLSVMNAGVVLAGFSWELPIETWELHVNVNLWGVIHGIRAAVPVMLERGEGHMVAVSSGAGLVATPLAPYVATKHAVVGIMESLHHELARIDAPVGTSVVCPGNIATNMRGNSMDAAGIDHLDLSPAAAEVQKTVTAGVEAGAEASTVADALAEAVLVNRFWVLPQPELAYGALDRVQRIVDGRPPLDLLSVMRDDDPLGDDPRSQRERMLAGDLYDADDPELIAASLAANRLTETYNALPADQLDDRRRLLGELLAGFGEGSEIRAPLHVDYGRHLRIGERTFVNFGLMALDVSWITIGDDVQIGPNVQLLTPTHPLDPELRRAKWEAAEPIVIGDNVWLGGGAIVLAGVTVGDNSVVGAGSVVTRDVPANVVAVGSPARVIRNI